MTTSQVNNSNNNEKKVIRVGIIGLGFMGNVHLKAYQTAKQAGYACEVVAVCDSDASRLTGKVKTAGNIDTDAEGKGENFELLFDPNVVKTYTDPAKLLANSEIDLVSICTHTDTHTDLAIAAMHAGKHVLVEKPVATSSKQVQRVLEVADSCKDLICMPAMCMRFWPGWDWLKVQVAGNTFGAVKSAAFHRLGTLPQWGGNFYADPKRSGGALVDLHVHDADFICHLFGQPNSVITNGTLDHLSTVYKYNKGGGGPAHVVAEGGWDHTPSFSFRMQYIVVFENATAEFDSSKAASRESLILFQNGGREVIKLELWAGYDGEIRALLNAINCTAGERVNLPTIAQSLAVTRVLEREHESLVTGEIVGV